MSRKNYVLVFSFILIITSFYIYKVIDVNEKLKRPCDPNFYYTINKIIISYFFEYKTIPENLSDFNKNYREKIRNYLPKDIFSTNGSLVKYKGLSYEGKILGYIIYSVGIDGTDDNGEILYDNWHYIYNIFKKGDLILGSGGYDAILNSHLLGREKHVRIDEFVFKTDVLYKNYYKVLEDSAKETLQKKDDK